jgi:hypothetical protein
LGRIVSGTGGLHLLAQLFIATLENPGQRGLRKPLTFAVEFREAGGSSKAIIKGLGLSAHFFVKANFLEDDAPGKQGEEKEDQQNHLSDRTAIAHQ